MPDSLRHVDDAALMAAIDGRLPAADREAFEAHVSSCGRCRAAYQALAWTARGVRRLREQEPPDSLVAGIRARLDEEDRLGPAARGARDPATPDARRAWRLARPAWLGAAAAAAVLLAVTVWWMRTPSLPDAIARDHQQVASQLLPLTIRSDRAGAVEDHLAERLGFRTPVYDLTEMGYHLVGARAHRIEGRASAMSVYEGPSGHLLICEMFPGSPDELPAADATRIVGGKEFWVFRRGEVTVVIWQSGPVLCALAGRADQDILLRMAVVKSGVSA